MAFTTNWPRVLRRSLRVFAGIVGLIVVLWLGLAWYVNSHKQELRAEIAAALGSRLRGDLLIGSVEPSLLRSFPDVSLSLKDVSLRDSLWTQHHHSLLEAKNLYVRINPFALLSRRVEVNKVIATHGSIFLYTDANGYSNAYLLEQRDTSKKNHPALVDRFGMEDMQFWFVNDVKQKLFHVHIKELDGAASRGANVMQIRVAASTHVYGIAFSTIRGAYLKNQDLNFKLALSYDIGHKHLHMSEQELLVGSYPLTIGGDFYFNQTPSAFNIHLIGRDIPYQTALSWASDNIRRTMQPYDFLRPISMDVHISGLMKYHSIPLIKVAYPITDNTLVTPLGSIEHLNYRGEYNNEAYPDRGHGDDNSLVAMYGLSGAWQGIPFNADTLAVVNLLKPVVKAHIKSSFPISSLQKVIGSNIISFDHGNASADIRFQGGILADDTSRFSINGYMRIAEAGLTYHPRSLVLSNVGATLLFQDDNLFFRDITVRSKQSSIAMEGDALHFLRLYFADPGKVSVAWRMRGPLINLNDFMGFATRRKSTLSALRAGQNNAAIRISNQLDRVLAEANFSLDARIDRMLYKSFDAREVVAQLSVNQSGILFQKVQIRSGGGSLNISGGINQEAVNNPFHIKALVSSADVAWLFSSFNDFGQSAINSDNLEGLINVDADVTGNVTDAGAILKNSFNGALSFNLKDGRIKHFQPFEKVGKVIFKKRNLSDVTVKDLQGRLEISGPKILIRPMNIQTSALNMNVQGIYGLGGGTDISIEVPLRNPEKDGANTPLGMLLRKGKGIVLHLRAQDPTGSGVKIGWDPLRHGLKATENALSQD